MAKAKVIDIAGLSPISTIEKTNVKNTVSGKAVADYVEIHGGGGGSSTDDTQLINLKNEQSITLDFDNQAVELLLSASNSSKFQNISETNNFLIFSGETELKNIVTSQSIISSSNDLTLDGDIKFDSNIISTSGNLEISAQDGSYLRDTTLNVGKLSGSISQVYGGIIIASGDIPELDNNEINIYNDETLIIQKGKFGSFPLTITWPYNTEYKGTINATESFNLKDKDGEYIIENGKLAHPQIVVCESESDLPSAEEQKDGILYIVLED